MTELILHKGQSSKALNLFKFDCKTNHESDVLLPTASHEVSALYKCTNEISVKRHKIMLFSTNIDTTNWVLLFNAYCRTTHKSDMFSYFDCRAWGLSI